MTASSLSAPPGSRTNWSGNYRYSAQTVFEPASVAEVQDAVLSVPSVRALGTRHCFNSIADSETAQISTLRLNGMKLDRQARTVTVGSGLRYGELARALDAEGFALANLASLPHISVGGACATATHGSGVRNGNLATAVRALEFVRGDGSVQRLARATDGDRFAGAVVSLGALGIVTHLTLAIEPSYAMTQTLCHGLPLRALEDHLPEIMGAGYSVSLFTDWQPTSGAGPVGVLWIKRRVHEAATEPPTPPVFHGGTLATEKMHPIPAHPAQACTDQLGQAGPWYQRLPHFQLDFTPSSGAELQSEYFVPFDQGWEAVRALLDIGDHLRPYLLISELRAVAADDLWMSMAYGRQSLAIHFTWKLDLDVLTGILAEIERRLKPFGARPHWGKLFTVPAPEIAALYPRLPDFATLLRLYDPQGRFRNTFVDRYIP